jgi:hypothetical protein
MNDDVDTEDRGASGITRRNVIKAGALVGGGVWAAPVVDSFVTRAAAGSVSLCPAPGVCGDNANYPCDGADCYCLATAEGTCACVIFTLCSTASECTATSQCPTGYACVSSIIGCGIPYICQAVCAGPDAAMTRGGASKVVTGSGPYNPAR